jgi:hypothetical protein
LALWPIDSFAPGAAIPPVLGAEAAVLAVVLLAAELEAAGAEASVAVDDELLLPQAARPPASATTASAPDVARNRLPHNVPIIVKILLWLSDD